MAGIEIHASRDEAVEQRPGGGSGCACGEHDDDVPVLDVQTIPHAIRHAAIFGAIEGLSRGGAMVISATHDPVPLLNQLAQRHGDAYTTEYGERGPERWRILVRRAA